MATGRYGTKGVHQGVLEKVVRSLFPKQAVIKNARKEANIVNPSSGSYLELDVWLPKLHICFEFQDPYHYIETWESHVPLADVKEQDLMKRTFLRQRKQTLVLVPCWWNGSSASIIAEIRFQRPDLLTYQRNALSHLVPLNPPPGYLHRMEEELPEIGDLMLASFPVSSMFTSTVSPENSWWMGEKYDGFRACWIPSKNALYSRSANEIMLPKSLLLGFVSCFTDGEIWFGRGDIPDSPRLTRPGSGTNWAFFRFVAFDNPNPKMNFSPFEERYKSLLTAIHCHEVHHSFMIVAHRVLCKDKQQLIQTTQKVIDEGGEGVILRKPASFYEPGRSKSLLKFKASREDKEALVVNFDGECFTLQLPGASTFSVPATSVTCKTTPKSGDVVSFSYQSYSSRSLPVKPDIFRIRGDLTWERVLKEHEEEAAPTQLNDTSRKMFGMAPKPMGHWVTDKGKNMRIVMENFAKNSLNFNPLVAENWYLLKRLDLMGGPIDGVLDKFGGSMVRALFHLFPEIGLDESKFLHLPNYYWLSMANRRKFFEELAAEANFDPLVAENWYKLSQDYVNSKGGRSVLHYYNNSHMLAIEHLFPDIGLDVGKFATVPRHHWLEGKNRRRFFEDFARAKGFDPLIPENWYSTSGPALLASKGASSIMSYYHGNFIDALLQLFPEVPFDPKKFSLSVRYDKWGDLAKKRNFFISFASAMGFDPLQPHNWYSVTSAEILAVKGGEALLLPYGGSFGKALVHLFPEIGLDETKLGVLPQNYWKDPKHRRAFFEDLASQRGMDPLVPSNWYSIPGNYIKAKKMASRVLSFYDGNVANALVDLFPDIGWDRTKLAPPW